MTARRGTDWMGILAGAAASLGAARLLARGAAPALPAIAGADAGRGAPGRPPEAQAMAVGYEMEDASASGLVRVIVIFLLSATSGVALMIWLVAWLHARDAARDAGLSATQHLQTAPPPPRLQSDPVGDLARLRQLEEYKLNGYVMLDQTHARIPVARAERLLIGRSLDDGPAPETRP